MPNKVPWRELGWDFDSHPCLSLRILVQNFSVIAMIKSDSMLTFLPQYLTFYDLLPFYHFDSHNFESRLKKRTKI